MTFTALVLATQSPSKKIRSYQTSTLLLQDSRNEKPNDIGLKACSQEDIEKLVPKKEDMGRSSNVSNKARQEDNQLQGGPYYMPACADSSSMEVRIITIYKLYSQRLQIFRSRVRYSGKHRYYSVYFIMLTSDQMFQTYCFIVVVTR